MANTSDGRGVDRSCLVFDGVVNLPGCATRVRHQAFLGTGIILQETYTGSLPALVRSVDEEERETVRPGDEELMVPSIRQDQDRSLPGTKATGYTVERDNETDSRPSAMSDDSATNDSVLAANWQLDQLFDELFDDLSDGFSDKNIGSQSLPAAESLEANNSASPAGVSGGETGNATTAGTGASSGGSVGSSQSASGTDVGAPASGFGAAATNPGLGILGNVSVENHSESQAQSPSSMSGLPQPNAAAGQNGVPVGSNNDAEMAMAEIEFDPPPNQVPLAVNDTVSTNEDTPVSINVLANDSDADGHAIAIEAWDAIATSGYGSVIFEAGYLKFTPDPDYNGQATFSYTVTDGAAYSLPATVTVTVNPVNDEVAAFDDAYGFSTQIFPYSLTPADGMLSNDIDWDLIAWPTIHSVDATGIVGSLVVSFSDGSFEWTPPEGFYGVTSFTYKVTDGNYVSNLATVTLWNHPAGTYLNPPDPPGPMNDAYPVGEDPITHTTDGVLANDDPEWSIAILRWHPGNGRLTSFTRSGGFTYIPDILDQGADFGYATFSADGTEIEWNPTGVDLYRVDVGIHNGQGGPQVNPRVERILGAFTVANLNDTDGDRIVDRDDSYVHNVDLPFVWPGEPEVDLMRLVLTRPNDPNPGNNMVQLAIVGNVKLWRSPYKVTEETARQFAPANLPPELWVEARAVSANLRDIQIEMSYRGTRDTVRATGIWVDKTNFRNTGDTLSPNADGWLIRWTHANLRTPWGAGHVWPRTNNGMEREFTVRPLGIGREGHIVFDVTRNKEHRMWFTSAGVRAEAEDWRVPFPAWLDTPNDDSDAIDEDNDPNPNNDNIYAIDATGYETDRAPIDLDRSEQRWNFNEFVRVFVWGGRFRNENNLAEGSRSSNFAPWRSRMDIVRNAATGLWVRNNADLTENEIREGHRPL